MPWQFCTIRENPPARLNDPVYLREIFDYTTRRGATGKSTSSTRAYAVPLMNEKERVAAGSIAGLYVAAQSSDGVVNHGKPVRSVRSAKAYFVASAKRASLSSCIVAVTSKRFTTNGARGHDAGSRSTSR